MAKAARKKKKNALPDAGKKKAGGHSSIPFAWLFRRGNKKKAEEPDLDEDFENDEPEEVSVDVITRHSDGEETDGLHEEKPAKPPVRRLKRRRITEEAAIYNDLPEGGGEDAPLDIKPISYDEDDEDAEEARPRRGRRREGREGKKPGRKKKAGSGRAVLLLLLLLAGGGAYLHFTDGLGPVLDAVQDLPALLRDVLSMLGL